VEKLYLAVDQEHFNVDVFLPADIRPERKAAPGIVMVIGGGGKDLLTGEPRGKYAAAYHDMAVHFSDAGFWVFLPSRRGDPSRTRASLHLTAPSFRDRLCETAQDENPNEGKHTHLKHVAELKILVQNLTRYEIRGLDLSRLGILGKSAGGGVALRLVSELSDRFASVALWGSALRTSQWFRGPKSDEFFRDVLDNRRVAYDRAAFLAEMCDAIDFVGDVTAPMLAACAAPDPYAPLVPETDRWSSPEEQLQLLKYATNCRQARSTVVKGAEHTMYRELAAWRQCANTLSSWFAETLEARI
jgi:alpha-beta hydrolase superfamily lysophospholipase